MKKFNLSLRNTHDLYCFHSDSKTNIKFMHSLIGCFIISKVDDVLDMQSHKALEIKLNQKTKRRVYFST